MPEPSTQKYFVRIRGKIMGPFGFGQLQSLKERGRLREEHEISSDRRQWEPAGRLDGLFASAIPEMAPATSIGISSQPAVEAFQETPAGGTQWFYSRGDAQEGPVSFSRLKKLVQNGDLGELDLVWNDGLEDWILAQDVEGLFGSTGPHGKSGRMFSKRRTTGYDPPRETVVWDAFLGVVRQQVTGEGLDATARRHITAGSLGMMVSTLAAASFLIVQAVAEDSARLVFAGVIAVLGISVLRYAGVHLSLAGDLLIKSTSNHVSSPAFFNSMAVVLLFTGIAGASAAGYYALATEILYERIAGVTLSAELLLLFGLAAFPALHPEWLAIDISPGARAGEEGIAVWSFFLKLAMRLATIAFGIGASIGAICLVAAVVCSLLGDAWMLYGAAFASLGAIQTLVAGVAPLLGYLCLVFGSIVLDVAQAIVASAKPNC